MTHGVYDGVTEDLPLEPNPGWLEDLIADPWTLEGIKHHAVLRGDDVVTCGCGTIMGRRFEGTITGHRYHLLALRPGYAPDAANQRQTIVWQMTRHAMDRLKYNRKPALRKAVFRDWRADATARVPLHAEIVRCPSPQCGRLNLTDTLKLSMVATSMRGPDVVTNYDTPGEIRQHPRALT